jgi:hypothetical protein
LLSQGDNKKWFWVLPTTIDPRMEISKSLERKGERYVPQNFLQFAVKKGAPMDSSVKLLKAAL